MTDYAAASRNIGLKALRRLTSVYKPFVRRARKHARAQEQIAFADEARAVEQEIAAVAAGSQPIVAGPWLAEVGYEALYWVPFLRWFVDAHRVPPERLTVISRGGVRGWYDGIAATYVELFDHWSPADLAARNDRRMAAEEGGGRKQSAAGALDNEILALPSLAGRRSTVLHPSLMFRLFRNVWHGSLPLDVLWTHTDYTLPPRPPRPVFPGLPSEYIAAKFYTGTALPDSADHREALRTLVRQATAIAPVVSLDTAVAVDDHADYLFAGMPDVISARDWMEPRTNLGVQDALAAHARMFLGTCGGLAWLVPFYGVPTVAVYADDRQLASHLMVARLAGRRAGAADFAPLDLRALQRLEMRAPHPVR
jgi:hypothetical protein